jgi:hypothetical protein
MRAMFCRRQWERKLGFFSTKKAQDACQEVVAARGINWGKITVPTILHLNSIWAKTIREQN